MTALLSPAVLRPASYAHSVVYSVLLWASLSDRDDLVAVLGWVHGFGWIAMSLLCLAAARARTIPVWLGVMVAVVGGVGPFAGSFGFWLLKRRGAPAVSLPDQPAAGE